MKSVEHMGEDTLYFKGKDELRAWILLNFGTSSIHDELLDFIVDFSEKDIIVTKEKKHLSSHHGKLEHAAGIGAKGKYLVYNKMLLTFLIELLIFGVGVWSLHEGWHIVKDLSIIGAITAFINTNPKWYLSIEDYAHCVFLFIWQNYRKTAFKRREVYSAYGDSSCCKVKKSGWDCNYRMESSCSIATVPVEVREKYLFDALASLRAKGILKYDNDEYQLIAGYYPGKQ